MSRIRKAFVAVVMIVIVATAVGVIANPGHHRAAPAVHVVTPASATPPAPPSADFEADTFLNLLSRIDPAVVTQLVNALSPADRATLAMDLETRTGLAAG